jgi:pimeloyl-ACP methyl ester carboxylesterase
MDVQPFTIHVPDEVLADLRARLAQTRWPDALPGAEWDYGSNLAYVKELVEYWRTRFDWRAQEQVLNRFAHFRTAIDGMGIHFIHERGKGPNPLPLLITHGWPSTFFELSKIIPLLADPGSHGGDPADAFDVVVPSMPGYGFSDRTTRRGMNVARIADLWAQLMLDGLGYRRYGAQGGDWGSPVTARLGFAYPSQLIGIHTTSVGGAPLSWQAGMRELSVAERTLLEARTHWQLEEGGYAHIQGTKPQTLAYGLNDSPAGLAAWIVEKWRTWSDCGGDIERRFTKDELLTTITIYWVTQTINSSTRLYYENQHNPWIMQPGQRIDVPCAMARFPKEISQPPREWAERFYNLRQWTEMPRGGHFAAFEEPALLAQDIRTFFWPLRGERL